MIHFIWHNFTPWCLALFPGRECPLCFFLKKKKNLQFPSPLTVLHSLSDSAAMSSAEEEEVFTHRVRAVAEGGAWLGQTAHLQPKLRGGTLQSGFSDWQEAEQHCGLDTGAASRKFQGVHQRGDEMKDTTSQRGSSEREGQGDAQIIHSKV